MKLYKQTAAVTVSGILQCKKTQRLILFDSSPNSTNAIKRELQALCHVQYHVNSHLPVDSGRMSNKEESKIDPQVEDLDQLRCLVLS